MEVLEAIHTRLSVGKLLPDPVPRELIVQMLDAAVQAPNHFKVRPWRFVVISGDARTRLGDVLANSLKKRIPDATESALDAERASPFRAPVIVAVGVDLPEEKRVSELENVCASAAAVENLLLAAHALGLGAKWRTGGAAVDPDVKAFLGFAPEQKVIALIYVGYPDEDRPPAPRQSYEDRTVWLD